MLIRIIVIIPSCDSSSWNKSYLFINKSYLLIRAIINDSFYLVIKWCIFIKIHFLKFVFLIFYTGFKKINI